MKKERLTVVKIGGACFDDTGMLREFLKQFSIVSGPTILVHGGGKIASIIGKKLGVEAKMIDGRRVTDEETLDLITMVYAGLLNKQIVARLNAIGINAFGLTGADGNLVLSTKRNPQPINFGFVGDPEIVNSELLHDLLNRNYVPVIAPVTHDGKGQLLNTNADTIASAVASSMCQYYDVHLVFAFEKNGVLEDPINDQSVIHKLTRDAFSKLSISGKIHSGMLPKLKAGFSALENNVTHVNIAHAHALHDLDHSTALTL